MVEKMLKNYISKLNIDDVYNYALKNGIKLTEDEANIIFYYIKNEWETLVFKDEFIILNKIKNKLSDKTYNKIIELITYFKQKYNRYL